MKELINISKQQINQETVDTVSARELHTFLEVGRDYTTWVKQRLDLLGGEEGRDFIVFTNLGENPNGGRPSSDYHVTLDIAKHIAMMERNDRGA